MSISTFALIFNLISSLKYTNGRERGRKKEVEKRKAWKMWNTMWEEKRWNITEYIRKYIKYIFTVDTAIPELDFDGCEVLDDFRVIVSVSRNESKSREKKTMKKWSTAIFSYYILWRGKLTENRYFLFGKKVRNSRSKNKPSKMILFICACS